MYTRINVYTYKCIHVYTDTSTLIPQFQFLCKPDLEYNHIKAIPKIIVCDAGTKQLTRAFAKRTTCEIEANQMRLSRLRLTPRPETY